MKYHKISCIILIIVLLTGCKNLSDNRKALPTVKEATQANSIELNKIKTSKSEEKKQNIEKPEIINQYAIIHYVGLEEGAKYKKEVFSNELVRINSDKNKSDKLNVISLLHTQDRYSFLFLNFLNKFNKLNCESMITSEAKELAEKILMVKDKKITVIAYEGENFYLTGALLYIKKNYENLDNFDITICAIDSPIDIKNYTKEFKNIKYNYFKIDKNKLILES